MTPETSKEIDLKRLRFRSGHRGCKETDLVLGNFAESAMAGLSPAMLALYARLLDEDDADIWAWLTGSAAIPPDYEPLLAMIRGFDNSRIVTYK